MEYAYQTGGIVCLCQCAAYEQHAATQKKLEATVGLPELTLPYLKTEARHFALDLSTTPISGMHRTTDGKAVGTFLNNDLGDFQTPPGLVSCVLATLQRKGKLYRRVLEPTCGCGNFIQGLLQIATPPDEIQAIELQQKHVEVVRLLSSSSHTTKVVVQQANLFHIDISHTLAWTTTGNLLVIGNPPWITNAALGSLNSLNLPKKENLKQLRGIAARTGESNFDIAEYIWLKLIRELISEKPTIALLCKTSTARNILKYCYDNHIPLAQATMYQVDSKSVFTIYRAIHIQRCQTSYYQEAPATAQSGSSAREGRANAATPKNQ